ncbi:MAG: NAD(P)H-hydrate dehydratase [Microbacteriaceae bacterium]|nr:NAD(P)H-hydrate dehydratase [Microbacteriaceae bacterium]
MAPAATTQWTAADAAAWITAPREDDDKYARGVVGFATGSFRYPGAAVIGVDAAIHTGVGMVRYSGPESVGRLVLERRPEAVLEPGQAQAWVLGSGMDSEPGQGRARMFMIENGMGSGLSPKDGTAFVLDAAAIGVSPTDLGPTIATPHAGELARLLGATRAEILAEPVDAAMAGAAMLDAVVLLKGATTYIALGRRAIAVHDGTPWLATAGSGDALAGVLGALIATRAARQPIDLESLMWLGATAALVHGRAARLAAGCAPDGSGGGPFPVLDLNRRLPDAVRQVLAS